MPQRAWLRPWLPPLCDMSFPLCQRRHLCDYLRSCCLCSQVAASPVGRPVAPDHHWNSKHGHLASHWTSAPCFVIATAVICVEVTHSCDTALARLFKGWHCRRRGHGNSRRRMLEHHFRALRLLSRRLLHRLSADISEARTCDPAHTERSNVCACTTQCILRYSTCLSCISASISSASRPMAYCRLTA